ncbi:MAG: NYN domain-containing protein [Patescibacteria group bacterium]|nr:NYN domain-containing protein [Patescibacteria group bacterium]MDD5294924.1 NYN domain-containing protein [Patescibacteria group bacterium]MDD5554320.1 NYN domain-containing protein [Patescibacteria group bacterium]
MIKHEEQRVGVFVDVSNMYHSAKNLFSKKVNFKEILKDAVAGRKLIRATAYVIKTESEEELHFFEALSQQGFEVRMKDLQIFAGGIKKADWDVGIAVDAIKLGDKLDVIVLVSGDGDYLPLMSYLQNTKGCLVEVMAFRQTASSKLVEESDDFTNLSDNKKYLR